MVCMQIVKVGKMKAGDGGNGGYEVAGSNGGDGGSGGCEVG